MFFRKLTMLAAAGTLCLVVGACGGADGATQDPLTEVDFSKFRLKFNQMYELANPHRLSKRIFYRKPSEGPDAVWFDAVKQGNLELVKRMAENGQDLEARDATTQFDGQPTLGQTALGWAAFIGYEDMVRYLVERGANIRTTDTGDVYHSVKAAVLGGNLGVIQYLYSRFPAGEVDWNKREDDNETLFLVGSVLGRYDFVKWVLENFKPELDVVSNPPRNQSPLSGACEEGFYDIAQLLIQHGAKNHKTGESSCRSSS